MRGRLLGWTQYESLLHQETLEGLVEAFNTSPYARTLEHTIAALDPTQPSRTIVRIDEALRRDLVQSLAKLRHFFSNHSLELVNALVLRWDVYNLKTVIRGKRASAQVEEILTATLPVGILDDIALAELARVSTVQAVAGTLETWRLPLARPVRTGLNLLGGAESLHPLECELDRFTFVQTAKLVANGDDDTLAVRNYLQFLVDKTNLLTALRYLAERSALLPIEAGRQFLKAEGRLTRSHYEAVVSAHDLRDGLSRLTETPYRWLAGTFAEGETISLPLIERKLDRMAIRKAVSLSRPDPLGIGMAIAYLEQKTNEVRNLRVILRGKALGMGVEQIAEWVIV
ncbi:MAG: V-type ATP synthase subunit C [Nitrospira sp.]|nr:MAG: V-type ATP synthase subunit C [Nitrospira sp.]